MKKLPKYVKITKANSDKEINGFEVISTKVVSLAKDKYSLIIKDEKGNEFLLTEVHLIK